MRAEAIVNYRFVRLHGQDIHIYTTESGYRCYRGTAIRWPGNESTFIPTHYLPVRSQDIERTRAENGEFWSAVSALGDFDE